jgi:hypothetical protein
MIRYNRSMVKIEDYIFVGKNQNTKRYRLYCDKCNIDRGYSMKSRSHMLCKKCTHEGKNYTDHSTPEFKANMSKAKTGQVPHNKGKGCSKLQRQLRCNFSTAIRARLRKRNGSKKGESYLSRVGYSIEDLIQHLESQFLPGMTWDNYGKYGWHIDHIKPDSSFKYENMDDQDFQDCWALSNLQPLWWQDNLIKSNKIQ